jgi:PAS domain S-box-containing protein
MPHGYCLQWNGPLLTAFVVGNLGIALAYFIIPAALRYFIGKRKDLPYGYMFKLFAAFILSCGITHIAKVWTLYQPAYWLEAGLDLFTAIISLLTAVLIFPLIPRALQLRSPKALEDANQQLQRMTEELQRSKEMLSAQVQERTKDLLAATQKAQEAEAFFRELFSLMPQLGWTAKADGYVDFYNQGWYDYTGTTFEQMQGWGWEAVFDPEILPVAKEKWLTSIRDGVPFEMKFPLKGANGQFEWFLTRINPLRDEEGKVVRWVGINTNIQPEIDQAAALEKLVEERTTELREAKETAEHALEAKTRFLATVSHEVRTPMAGIIGVAELIHLSASEEETRSLSKVALESCKRLLQILNNLLDASKLQAGAVSIEFRLFAVRPVIGDVVQLAASEAEKKQLNLSSIVDAAIPDLVCGDELRVRQIIQNLVFNAIKFTAKGGVAIRVELVEQSGSTSVLQFSVTDTGIGISDDQKIRLFEPFAQADDSTTRIYGGTGLGLHICRTLTELMEGEIGVESEPEKGSTFWVRIPFFGDRCRMD